MASETSFKEGGFSDGNGELLFASLFALLFGILDQIIYQT
jgi:hypothetical protein